MCAEAHREPHGATWNWSGEGRSDIRRDSSRIQEGSTALNLVTTLEDPLAAQDDDAEMNRATAIEGREAFPLWAGQLQS